jgi:hypothetical protein
MVIHRRTLHNVPVSIYTLCSCKWLILSLILQTRPCTVSGYLWGKWPHRCITRTFFATSPLHGDIISPPYVDIEGKFFLPWFSPPEVFDTLMCVASYKILVTGYLNLHNRSFPNPNLLHDFPLIPWKGEIAVLFIGKHKPYVSWAPPKSLLCFAIAKWVFVSYVLPAHCYFPFRYMTVCIAHAETGYPFLSYIERSAFHLMLSTDSSFITSNGPGQGISVLAR